MIHTIEILPIVLLVLKFGSGQPLGDTLPRRYGNKNISTAEQITKIKVSVYTESLCPDCHAFIHEQLAPTYSDLSDYIELDMVPFGNADMKKTNNGWSIECQHGPEECLGNLFEACATELLEKKDPRKLMNYYDCLTRNPDNIEEEVKKCAKENNINFDKLNNCAKNEGTDIVVAFGKRTNALRGKTGVPAIALNDNFEPDDQDKAEYNFKEFLCQQFKGNPPPSCDNKNDNFI